jgi:selenocysteine-specific elongation factor
MKHVIIGTAGHIDHGKTALIKALTGRETDTLKEEKERGISIDLGFTFFDLPSNRRAGIIDVPGHEKFIKNMLAGASSIDIVLLVIAADEGIMPQTREHLQILQLLKVKKGIVVITKSDLVQEDWLEMIEEQIKEELKGTFLENAPNIVVSSKTGKGISELIGAIDEFTEVIEAKDTESNFRLPVDRVFSVSGFGTVVTGTIISGRIKEGETVELYPSKIKTKVRNIQVHEKVVSYAEAGQRAALNLSGIKVEEVRRGNVISKEELMEPSLILDSSLYLLEDGEKPLKNRQRVRLYHGTEELLCRVVILDKEEIKQGERAYVQLRLEKPMTANINDRFVIRSYSPMHTIGGGTIIDPVAKKAKAFDLEYIEQLKVKESGKSENIVENIIEKYSADYPDLLFISKALGKSEGELEAAIEKLLKDTKVLKFSWQNKEVFIHKAYIKKKAEELQGVLDKFHKENPLKLGMSKEEIKNKIFSKNIKQGIYDEILQELSNRMVIKIINNFVALIKFEIKHTKDQIKLINFILEEYDKARYSPPKYEDLSLMEKDKKKFKMIFDYLLLIGEIIKNNEECILHKNHYQEAKQKIINYIATNGSITVGECRDLLNTTRKYAVAILEHLDADKVTKRVEDRRVKY